MIWRIIILMILLFLSFGAAVHQSGQTPDEFTNTKSKVSYSYIMANSNIDDMVSNVNITLPVRIIYKYADFLIFTTIEGGKYAMDYGYENPEYNYLFLAKVLFFFWILTAAIPIIYLVVFIWYCFAELFKALKKIKEKKRQR